jgi:hypothetical protein
MEKEITEKELRLLRARSAIQWHFIIGHLADVMYGMYFEVERLLNKEGCVFKHEEKRAFNEMMSSVEKSNKLLLRYTKVFLGKNDKEFDDFCDASDGISMVFKTFVSKWFKSKENQDKIMCLLASLEGSPIFQQDAEQLTKLVLESIEEEKKEKKVTRKTTKKKKENENKSI